MSDHIVVESNYKPTVPAARFHGSNAFITVLVGGVGSGKSYSLIKELEMLAIEHPRIPMAMYRKTLPALRDSTLHEFKEHVDESLGKWGERDVQQTFHNGSFLRFRGLDQESKSKSTNYAVLVMEEAEEFTKEDFQRLKERVRATNKDPLGKPFPLRLIILLNPVDEDHWIYKEFVENAEEYEKNGGLEVIKFSTRDNLENLPPNYIETVSSGKTPDEIARYIDGEWGSIIKGKPVYKELLTEWHLRKIDLYPGMTILRGWDFGYNHPAVSFRAVDEFGRMNIRHVEMGTKIHLDDFVPIIKQKTLELFGPTVQLLDFGDPRGHDKGQGKKETAFDILTEHGINATGERGSRDYVEDGIKQVRKEMSTLIQGVPQLTIDPGCSLIRTAYYGKYVRGDDGKPVKDGYYEHVCDADRYISHHHRFNDAVKDAMRKYKQKRDQMKHMRNSVTGY